jgi:thioredoxin 1
MIAPIIDELSTEYEGKATIAKVNVDENQDLAQKFGVRGIPTMLFIKNGEVMDTLVGASSKQNIADKINKLIGD